MVQVGGLGGGMGGGGIERDGAQEEDGDGRECTCGAQESPNEKMNKK